MNNIKPMHEVGDLVYFIGLPEKTLGLVKKVHLLPVALPTRRYWYSIDWILYNGLTESNGHTIPERFYGDELKKAQVEQ
jgi:hypothetical protein